MKKRLLSAVLAGSMMLTMLLSTAFAAEGDTSASASFQVDGETYSTLKEAIDNHNNAETITLTGTFTGTENNVAAIPENVNLLVTEDSELNLPVGSLTKMVSSKGSIEVEAGADLVLSGAHYIGSTDEANFKPVSGSMMLQEFEGNLSAFKMDIVVTEGSVAEIPAAKNVTLMPQTWGADLTVEKGATLDVNGGLRAVDGPKGGEHSSTITVDGTLDMTDGFLSMGGNADLYINSTGWLYVGEKGVITDSITNGYPANASEFFGANALYLEEGGIVCVREENTLNMGGHTPGVGPLGSWFNFGETPATNIKTEDSENGDHYYYIEGSTPFAPSVSDGSVLNSLLEKDEVTEITVAPAGEEEQVVVSLSTSEPLAAGKTLKVASGAKLQLTDADTVSAILAGEGTVEVAAGGAVSIPASLYQAAAGIATLADTEEYIELIGENGLFKLEENSSVNFGSATGSLKGTVLTITSGTVTVDQAVRMAMGGTPISIVVQDDATLKVEATGSLASEEGATITVESGATADFAAMANAEQAAAVKGNIVIKAGATVTYAGEKLVADSDALFKLESDSSTTLNIASSTLTLDGKATLTASGDDDVPALLPVGEGTLPLRVTVAENAELSIPEGKHMTFPNNSALVVNGKISVENGTLDINPMAEVSGNGTITVSGASGRVNLLNGNANDPTKPVDVKIELSNGGGAFIQPARADSVKTDKISGGVAVETEDGTVFVQRTGIVVTINGKESATTYNDLAEALNGTAGQTDVAITLLGTDGS